MITYMKLSGIKKKVILKLIYKLVKLLAYKETV